MAGEWKLVPAAIALVVGVLAIAGRQPDEAAPTAKPPATGAPEAYPPTVIMYDAKGTPYSVRADWAWGLYNRGALGFAQEQQLQVQDMDDGGRTLTLTGNQISAISRGALASLRYKFVGVPNATVPTNLPPPEELLPKWPPR